LPFNLPPPEKVINRLLKKYLFMFLFVIPAEAGIQNLLNLQGHGFPLKTCGNDIDGHFVSFSTAC
jgi:hypothetical protein